jgi:hypothetical protein
LQKNIAALELVTTRCMRSHTQNFVTRCVDQLSAHGLQRTFVGGSLLLLLLLMAAAEAAPMQTQTPPPQPTAAAPAEALAPEKIGAGLLLW